MNRCEFRGLESWMSAINNFYGNVTIKTHDLKVEAFKKSNWQLVGEFDEETMTGYVVDRRRTRSPVQLEKRMQLEVIR